MLKSLRLAAVGFLIVPALANAGPVSDLATEAEKKITDGDTIGGYDTMRQALAKASDAIPLNIRKAFFVTEKPLIFGGYERVAKNEFPVGSQLITYAEPVGLAWVNAPKGVQSAFTVDFELKNPAGEILAVQKAFGNFKIESREPLFEIFTPLTLDVSAVPPGDYVLTYTFTDANTKKTTSVDQRFTLK